MNHEKATNYTVVLHMYDGSTDPLNEWFSLGVAKKIAAKAFEARESVVNSPVKAIEVVDIDGKRVAIAEFKE